MSGRATAMLLGIAALIAAPAVSAQNFAPQDRDVIVKLHHANQMEIQAGQLAEQKGIDPEVRRYGALLVRDHRKADGFITSLAAHRGLDSIPLPAADTAAEQAAQQQERTMMSQLDQARGSAFDAAFIDAMVKTHEQAVTMVTAAVSQVRDPDLRSTLEEVLPILKQHLTIAEWLSPAGSAPAR